MTTLAQTSTNLRRLKRGSRLELLSSRKPCPQGDMDSLAKTSAATPSKIALDKQIAEQELALAAVIRSDPMSIRLPCASYVCLKGKTLPTTVSLLILILRSFVAYSYIAVT